MSSVSNLVLASKQRLSSNVLHSSHSICCMTEIDSEKIGIGIGSSALARDRKSSRQQGSTPSAFSAQARAASWACLWQR